jgi:lipid A 3-O-deacylase
MDHSLGSLLRFKKARDFTNSIFFLYAKFRFPLKKQEMRSSLLLFLLPLFLFSAAPPDYLSVATGVFNILKEKNRTVEFDLEYKVHLKWLKSPNRYLEFRPLLGVMATVRGSIYIYAGLNFDLLFCDHILFAPGFAAGYYAKGNGKDLGFPLEFRSGVELAWQFSDCRRLGLHFYHLSNASIGHKNPGEESLVIYYDIPLIKGFPFIK